MKKYLFYALQNEKMCFIHVLLNALDLKASGHEVKIIFEGKAVNLPIQLAEENNPHYNKALEQDLIAGVCLACSKSLGAYEGLAKLNLPFLSDMSGHAGVKPYTEQDYLVLTF